MGRRFAVLWALVAGCAAAPPPRAPTPIAAAALPFALPFIGDDYPRALAEARRTKLPLFVETWAPW